MTKWWDESAGFFGEFYMYGDASVEGHLVAKKLSLDERTMYEVSGVVRLLKAVQSESILDVPCGYGRHSIELAKRGFSVHGIDINAVHLNAASKQANSANLKIQFTKQCMLDLSLNDQYDAVINMFYSFGFFDTDEENMQVLRNFKQALKPGGRFLMHTDVNIPRIAAGTYKTDEARHLPSGDMLHIQDRYNATTKRIEGVWRIEKDRSITEKAYSVRVYDEDEFKAMCLQAGFSSCVSYGDWHGNPYHTTDSEEIIFVATN